MLVEVSHLSKRYGPHLAVSDLNFSISRGDVVGFLGPNGAGKTTTMNLLTGFLSPSAGEVKIAGISMQDNPREAKRVLGYLPETPPLYPDMTVRDYLLFVGGLHGLGGAALKSRLDFVLHRSALESVYKRLIAHLSKGYRQRVGIAQALIADPQVIILDEPTVGLDPLQIIEIRALIRELGQDHTLILSTHILPEVAMTCKKVLIINDGRLVAEDSYEGLANRLEGTHQLFVRGEGLSLELLKPVAALQEVLSVDPVIDPSGAGFAIHAKPDFDIEGEIVRRAASGAWKLKELRPYRASLEDIFLKLTREEGLA